MALATSSVRCGRSDTSWPRRPGPCPRSWRIRRKSGRTGRDGGFPFQQAVEREGVSVPVNRDVVLAEWRRSTQALQAADLLSREDYREDAVSRAYYSILHAAKAALLVHDVATASHAGVRRMFGKHLVLTGDIEGQWSKYLGRSSDDRLMADYDAGIYLHRRGIPGPNASGRESSSNASGGICWPRALTDLGARTGARQWMKRTSSSTGRRSSHGKSRRPPTTRICREFRIAGRGSRPFPIWSRTTTHRPAGARTTPAAGRAGSCWRRKFAMRWTLGATAVIRAPPTSPAACSSTGSRRITRSPASTCRSATTSASARRSRR